MKWIVALLIALGLAVTLGGYVLAVEEPAFQSVLKDGDYELRDYPALIVAETTASGGQKEAVRDGFRVLAAYIFGANRTKQKIAMTAPVAQQPSGEKIAMTAPVAQQPSGEKIAMTAPVAQTLNGDQWVVRFTMPAGYTLESLPEPADARVKLRATPAERLAVVRFSGLARPDDVAAKTAQLSAWIAGRQLRPTGPPTLAQYNPPWTLWFMRRNEVMIAVER